MQIFLDTANYKEIAERYATGLVSGITTNPTLVRKSGVDYFDFIRTLSRDFAFESISAEVDGKDADEMIENAQQYINCLLYTSPSPRDATLSRMPSSA